MTTMTIEIPMWMMLTGFGLLALLCVLDAIRAYLNWKLWKLHK